MVKKEYLENLQQKNPAELKAEVNQKRQELARTCLAVSVGQKEKLRLKKQLQHQVAQALTVLRGKQDEKS